MPLSWSLSSVRRLRSRSSSLPEVEDIVEVVVPVAPTAPVAIDPVSSPVLQADSTPVPTSVKPGSAASMVRPLSAAAPAAVANLAGTPVASHVPEVSAHSPAGAIDASLSAAPAGEPGPAPAGPRPASALLGGASGSSGSVLGGRRGGPRPGTVRRRPAPVGLVRNGVTPPRADVRPCPRAGFPTWLMPLRRVSSAPSEQCPHVRASTHQLWKGTTMHAFMRRGLQISLVVGGGSSSPHRPTRTTPAVRRVSSEEIRWWRRCRCR